MYALEGKVQAKYYQLSIYKNKFLCSCIQKIYLFYSYYFFTGLFVVIISKALNALSLIMIVWLSLKYILRNF